MRTLISPLTESLWQVKVPLPFPLRWVNAYVAREDDGFTVIDPGLHTDEAKQAWDEALRSLGAGLRSIRQVIVTHHHPDHFGLAGWFQERSGAPVMMSPAGIMQARRLWDGDQPISPLILEQFRRHGMDAPMLERMEAHLRSFVPLVTPFPRDVTPIEPGQAVRIGGAEWETFHAPGHALGQLCLYHAGKRAMFCGDHVLPRITPNISLIPGVDDDPLASYLYSLAKVKALDVETAYPGHRDPFAGFAARVGELEQHHSERLDRMLTALAVPMTGYALCRLMFGERLSVHQLRFALAETLAHIVYLERREQVRSRDEDGKLVYSTRE